MNNGKSTFSAKVHAASLQKIQDEALLFQYVLHEILFSCHCLLLPSTQTILQALVGDFCQFRGPYLSAYRQSGSLLKLYYYLELLSVHFPKRNSLEDPLFKGIIEASEKSIKAASDCQRYWEKNGHSFSRSWRLLNTQMKKIQKLIPKKIYQYQQNENILFFLLKRRTEFDALYQDKMVSKLLQSFFQGGAKEAGEWISAQYRQRKFLHLIPKIRLYVDALLQN